MIIYLIVFGLLFLLSHSKEVYQTRFVCSDLEYNNCLFHHKRDICWRRHKKYCERKPEEIEKMIKENHDKNVNLVTTIMAIALFAIVAFVTFVPPKY